MDNILSMNVTLHIKYLHLRNLTEPLTFEVLWIRSKYLTHS